MNRVTSVKCILYVCAYAHVCSMRRKDVTSADVVNTHGTGGCIER